MSTHFLWQAWRHPLHRALLGLAAVGLVTATGSVRPVVWVRGARAAQSSAVGASGLPPCAAGTLPDHAACVSFRRPPDDESDALVAQRNWHHERNGSLRAYDQVPRSPDRPEDYNAYRYPLAPPATGGFMISGYDLDLPDEQQRRGPGLRAVGHGAVDLLAPRGTELHAVPLEHQEGDAEVIFVGPLIGTTVATRHRVREGGQLRSYLVLLGHLDNAAAGLTAGMSVHEGDLLGFVGDTGSRGLVHLHLEVRRVRESEEGKPLGPGQLTAQPVTVVVDPRNVLALRSP